MQIHELPIGVPGNDDFLAMDNGISTRKTPFSQFEVGGNPLTFETADDLDPIAYTDPDLLESGETGTLMGIVSEMLKNVRYIFNHILTASSVIPDNSDINNYTEIGNYRCANQESAATLLHPPTTLSAFQMLVFKYGPAETPTIFQIVWRNSIGTPIVYRCRASSGTWGDWIELVKQSVVEPIGTVTMQRAASSGVRSITAGTVTNLTSISLPAGKYVVNAHASFASASSSTTYRLVAIGSTSSNTTYALEETPALPSNDTILTTSRIFDSSSAFTLYLNVQTGTTANVNLQRCIIEAIRIK